MRCVLQRVEKARVVVDGTVVGEIGAGVLGLIGVEKGDGGGDVEYIEGKIAGVRIFEDDGGKMNWSVLDVGGEALVVSQFTLCGDGRHGKRPSYSDAEAPERANELYLRVVDGLRGRGIHVETGVFQTHMKVELVNDGPVTILLDSRRHF